MRLNVTDIIMDAVALEIRGVTVKVRGFTFRELGNVISLHPVAGAALIGQAPLVAIMGDPAFLKLALQTCVETEQELAPTADEQVILLDKILEMTIKVSLGPFVEMSARLAPRSEDIVTVLTSLSDKLSPKNSSPQSAA